jgi:CDP-glycerol glycerophosphotransferase (TagB/SpsB family)
MMLERYWDMLHEKADCWWGVTHPRIYNLLMEKNISNVVYHHDELIVDHNKAYGNKCVSSNPGHSERIVAERIKPDIWISDTLNKLHYVPKDAFWVQVFHSLPIKKHFFYPSVLDYDLLLLPGEYHKHEIIKRLNFKERDEERLKVVGWPRTDDFFNGKFDRQEIMNTLELDQNVKTILYAPTWGWGYGNETLFARWFDREVKAFEQICHKIRKMDLNFIVKLHPLSFHANNQTLINISKKYKVLWLTKEISWFVDDPNPFLWITDILISDLSGIIAEFMVLDRPIIYIDPDEKLDAWDSSDMPKNFRAGHIVKSPEELLDAIDNSIKFPERFKKERNNMVSKLFHSPDGMAIDRAVQEILNFARRKGLN